MKLNELFEEKEEVVSDDLPPEVIESLKKEITSLAKDTQQQWTNALQLVQQAYEHCDVERPTPAMRDAWRQYEEFITQAVHALNKYQPNGDWRMIAADTPSPAPVTAY